MRITTWKFPPVGPDGNPASEHPYVPLNVTFAPSGLTLTVANVVISIMLRSKVTITSARALKVADVDALRYIALPSAVAVTMQSPASVNVKIPFVTSQISLVVEYLTNPSPVFVAPLNTTDSVATFEVSGFHAIVCGAASAINVFSIEAAAYIAVSEALAVTTQSPAPMNDSFPLEMTHV